MENESFTNLQSNVLKRELSPRVIFNHKSFPKLWHVSLFKVEVRSSNDSLTFIGGNPVHNLGRVGPQKGCVVFIDRFSILARENPDVEELTVANEL